MIAAGSRLTVLAAVVLIGIGARADVTIEFRQGLNGYLGVSDTMLNKQSNEHNYGASTLIVAQDEGPYPAKAILIRFEDVFGSGQGQVPYGQTITNATLGFFLDSDDIDNLSLMKGLTNYPLIVNVPDFGSKDDAPATLGEVSRYQRATGQLEWGPPTGVGPQPDVDYDTTMRTTVDYTYSSVGTFIELNVTAVVSAWYEGQLANCGLLVHGTTSNTASSFCSSEYLPAAVRPYLKITYEPPPAPQCGDAEHPYPTADFDKDCYVGILDFAMLVQTWLICTDVDPPCNYIP